MLLQTFSLLLNVSFLPCFPSPLLLSLSLFSFFFFRGGGRRERPRLNPRLETFDKTLKFYTCILEKRYVGISCGFF